VGLRPVRGLKCRDAAFGRNFNGGRHNINAGDRAAVTSMANLGAQMLQPSASAPSDQVSELISPVARDDLDCLQGAELLVAFYPCGPLRKPCARASDVIFLSSAIARGNLWSVRSG
jgi:hypothetical protein